MSIIACVEDLRILAPKRVPKFFDDYADSGSYNEFTCRANSNELAGIQWDNGEMLGAIATQKFRIPCILSTARICSIEDVASVTTKPFWFHLYVIRDHDFIKSLIDRAKATKCSKLTLMLDLQILGKRQKDLKNSMSVPPKMMLTNLIDLASRPG